LVKLIQTSSVSTCSRVFYRPSPYHTIVRAECHAASQAKYTNVVLRNVTVVDPAYSPGVLLANATTSPMTGVIFHDVVRTTHTHTPPPPPPPLTHGQRPPPMTSRSPSLALLARAPRVLAPAHAHANVSTHRWLRTPRWTGRGARTTTTARASRAPWPRVASLAGAMASPMRI